MKPHFPPNLGRNSMCGMYKIVCCKKKSFLDPQKLRSWQSNRRENPVRYWNEETRNQHLEGRFYFCFRFYYFTALWPWVSHLSLGRHFLLSQVVIRTPVPTLLLRVKCSIRAGKVLWKFKVTIYMWVVTNISIPVYIHVSETKKLEMTPNIGYSWQWQFQDVVSFYWCSCTCANPLLIHILGRFFSIKEKNSERQKCV